jgi:UDP-2,3-diacylglucosamine hydrolase
MKDGGRAQYESADRSGFEASRIDLMRCGIDTVIHGHSHRPAVHDLQVEGHQCQRIVLGD